MSSSQEQFVLNLYQQYHSWIYHWLYSKLGNSSDAADLAQDTFVRLLFVKQAPIELDEPRAYLVKIAKNLMLNWIQRKSIERAYLDVLSEKEQFIQHSPEHDVLIIETLTEVIQLLAELPDVVIQAFIYSQLEGLKHKEIADRLDISVSTVKRYIKQAYIHCLMAIVDLEDL